MANLTIHGRQRVKQRCHIKSKRAIQKYVNKVFKKGIKHSEVTGDIKKYIDALYFKYKTANNIRLYKNRTYIFAGQTLVTVFETPSIFLKEIQDG